jgi:molecular chaperone DnaK (HSP70)
MAEGAGPALGLSIGSTNLAAVTADHAITRKPVLTLFRQRPPEVGVPSENPKLDEPGLVITDFVDQVGDPVAIEAADGSVHRSDALAADALRALAYTATGGRPLPESVAITYPAHWGRKAVDELGSALSRVSEWSNRTRPLTLIPDAAAALFAVRANPGVPGAGIVAVCDFGGSGTSITLVDAAGEYQPLGPTVRYPDFSGELLDQALLTTVMANLPGTGSFDRSGTSAIGSLARLRAECRIAKEQLSSSTVATLLDEVDGSNGDIRVTRADLDDAIRDSLANFMAFFEKTLESVGIRGSDLAAVVSVGGVASLPVVTTMLSGSLRVPVVTTPRPQLTAAIGGALRAARRPGDTGATTSTPAAAAVSAPAAEQSEAGPRITPWYRLPAVVLIGAVVALLLAGVAVAIGLSPDTNPGPGPAVHNSPAPPVNAPSSVQPAP